MLVLLLDFLRNFFKLWKLFETDFRCTGSRHSMAFASFFHAFKNNLQEKVAFSIKVVACSSRAFSYNQFEKLCIRDPVLPMILSGLTMNFILYEKDYGLAIARLCIVVSTFK